jgi:hypothetical protein
MGHERLMARVPAEQPTGDEQVPRFRSGGEKLCVTATTDEPDALDRPFAVTHRFCEQAVLIGNSIARPVQVGVIFLSKGLANRWRSRAV